MLLSRALRVSDLYIPYTNLSSRQKWKKYRLIFLLIFLFLAGGEQVMANAVLKNIVAYTIDTGSIL